MSNQQPGERHTSFAARQRAEAIGRQRDHAWWYACGRNDANAESYVDPWAFAEHARRLAEKFYYEGGTFLASIQDTFNDYVRAR